MIPPVHLEGLENFMKYVITIATLFLISGCNNPNCPPENEIGNFTDTCQEANCTYAGKCYGQDTWYKCQGEGCVN